MSSSGRTKQNNNNNNNNKKKKKNEVPSKISSSSGSEEEEEEEVKSSNNSNQNVNEDEKKKEKSKNSRKNKEVVSSSDTGVGSCCFPANRINRIIRSEGADFRITQESIFLINKATYDHANAFSNKFINKILVVNIHSANLKARFKAHTMLEALHFNLLGMEALPFAVSKGKKYDFLSDFVPDKIRAEDALLEREQPRRRVPVLVDVDKLSVLVRELGSLLKRKASVEDDRAAKAAHLEGIMRGIRVIALLID
ncbi:hypothetical protein IFM89_014481 [Coptis chinensis]|uniref:Uncharacterized protein n=1 Tax=Coptis chinensis TaxID=261450 RepID=A0A835LLI2_9MAGN|nr:hypothetical protein IFM89_014481 [Coptis chinensis]